MKFSKKQAFTLTELVVSMVISAIVLSGLFYFLTETQVQTVGIEEKTKIYVELSNFIE
jgi:prepilin-type N-terminal cleavage/methylation domain-containing protein